MSRQDVLRKVDSLLERFGPFDNDDALELLREGLNTVFVPSGASLADPPWAAFHAIYRNSDGKLTAIVESLHIQNDIQEWCKGLQDYLDGRLLIEPEENVDVKSLMAMRLPDGEE